MYIERICCNNHKILGNFTLPFVSKSNIPAFKDCVENVSIDTSDDTKNLYTYIIGQNGVGKTTIFRTLINYIYGEMHPLKASVARALSDQSQMFEKPFELKRRKSCGSSTFLADNDNLRVLHISNTPTILSEGDFEEFLEVRPVLDNTSLRMLPLIYKRSENLEDLVSFLHCKESKWSMNASFANLIDTNIEFDSKGCMVILNGDDEINALSLRDFIETVLQGGTTEKHSLFERKLIIASKGETDSLCTNLAEICSIIKESHIYSIMCEYFTNATDSYSIHDSIEDGKKKIVFMPNMEGRGNWLQLEFNDLDDKDLIAIPILAKLKVLSFDILLDSVPINNMSSGEKVMVELYSILAKFANQRTENILMLYDEPENSLHPEWQQLFPVLFRTIVENLYGITRSHFIFLTHSPLIIQRAYDEVSKDNTSIFKLSRIGKQITYDLIDDCHRYCIEELMLDHFNIEYRRKEKYSEVVGFLNGKNVADPIDDTNNIPNIKADILKLYNEVMKKS